MSKVVTAREAAHWIASGEAVLVDVRSAEEYRAEHIAEAMSLPLDTLPGTLKVPPGRKLVFQCLKGGRGAKACALMDDIATDSYNLEGGIDAWKAAGLPVVTA